MHVGFIRGGANSYPSSGLAHAQATNEYVSYSPCSVYVTSLRVVCVIFLPSYSGTLRLQCAD